jgi:hypothetical protein
MATDLLISLINTSGSEKIKVSDNDILRVYPIASGTGSNILYDKKGSYARTITVNETAAQIAGLSKQLVPVTVNSTTEFISAMHIVSSVADPEGGGGALITYNVEGAMPTYITVSETAAAIQLLINAKAATLVSSDAITGINRTNNTFTVATNVTAKYTNTTIISVVDSTGNDRTYTVTGSAFGAATVITVTETISSATVDGTIIVVNTQ